MKITHFPTNSMQVSSEFGDRIIKGALNHHRGIDFAVNKAPVYAAANGTVIKAGTAGGIGKMIAIEHEGVVISLYHHLNSFANSARKYQQ